MAQDDKKKTSMAGLLHPTLQTSQKVDPTRKGSRRSKTAPLAEYVPGEMNGTEELPRSDSIFGSKHPPRTRKIIMMLLMHLSAGTSCFYALRDQITGVKTNGVLDAIYFCIVTMTTVGYGDLVPTGVATKLLSNAFVFTGMALVSLILTKVADSLFEKQEVLIRAMHMRRKDGTEILKEVETDRLRYRCFVAIMIIVLHIVAGTVFQATVEKLDIVDAFYFACSSITTLGYGDKNFSTAGGRVFATIWILTSTLSLAQFFLYIAEYHFQSRQKALVKWILSRKMTNVDLEAADINDDRIVGAAEFVICKLKEMGKISQEDISLVMDEFEKLDVKQSGTLSVSDINLAQCLKR